MRDRFDRGSKWLIEHHGDSILHMAGITDVLSWKAVATELVQPKQLPDGLLEVVLRSDPAKAAPHLIEMATYPEERLRDQVVRDAMLVFLDKRVVPDVVTIILRPKGNLRISGQEVFRSVGGTTRISISWKVVEVWNIPAEQLLAANDVGLVPWIPLTQFSEPPEDLLAECRRRIDADASAEERENLLVVSQVLAQLRYDQESVLQLLGGKQTMIESPLIQEIVAERMHKAIHAILADRFGSVPKELSAALQRIDDEDELDHLAILAGRCKDLAEFGSQLSS